MDGDGILTRKTGKVQIQGLGCGVVDYHGGNDEDGVRTDGQNLEPFVEIGRVTVIVEMTVLVSVELERRGNQPVVSRILAAVVVGGAAVVGFEGEGLVVPIAVLHTLLVHQSCDPLPIR